MTTQRFPNDEDAEVEISVSPPPQATQTATIALPVSPPPPTRLQSLLDEVTQELKQEREGGSQGTALERQARRDPETTAAVVGAAQAFFETGDFISETFGFSERHKSQFRQDIEAAGRIASEESTAAAAIRPISQFVVGLIGAGKITGAAKALGIGRTARTPIVRMAAESTKAAAVGAVVFDPHEERLSNVIESFPELANPVTGYLAADPKDSKAEARFKVALESLGMDAVLVGAFKASARAYRAIRSGDAKGAAKATKEAETALSAADDGAEELELPGYTPALRVEGKVYAATDVDALEVAHQELKRPIDEIAEVAEPGFVSKDGAFISSNDPNLTAIARPSDAAASQGVPQPPKVAKPKQISEASAEALLQRMHSDTQALRAWGSRQRAIEAGYEFGGESLPWQKLSTTDELDAFVGNVADAMRADLDKAKGGAKLPDNVVERLVEQRVRLWGDEPDHVRGILIGAGDNARTLAANMEAADTLAIKSMDEAYQVLAKIRFGNLGEWGGDRAAALLEFRKRAGVATSLLAAGRSMLSNAGRTLRRGRGDMPRMSLEDIRKLDAMDPEKLAKLFEATGGDIHAIKEALSRPSMLARAVNMANFLLVNNLLWGLTTHAVNLAGTAVMMGTRPLGRWAGSYGLQITGNLDATGASAMRTQAVRQYRFMATSILDSARVAAKAFVEGDSILTPFKVEWYRYAAPQRTGSRIEWKSGVSPEALLANSLMATKVAIGFPTRALGFVDEIARQSTYRGMVLAEASIQADKRGLAGETRTAFMRKSLAEAFDAQGAAIDARAAQEAKVATFTQDLLHDTAGASMQSTVAKHPLLRQVVPFVRTPVNVLRYGVKLTPGLNLLQKEYRDMIRGSLGPEAQADAVGQMALGTLMMSSVAVLVGNGMFTGSGPSDTVARRNLTAAGWKPNSIVIQNDDGTTSYYQLGRLDPLGLPAGIIADLMDIYQHPDKKDAADNALVALGLAMAHQVRERTYVQNLVQLFDALAEPDKRGANFAGRTVSNLIPFSSALKNYGGTSMQYMREARTIVDNIMATVPGLAEGVPLRYDAFGDPIRIRRGPWSKVEDDVVDEEIIRMGVESGFTLGVPSPNRGKGVDLRDVTLEDGRNAYAAFQEYAGKPSSGGPSLKQSVAKLIQSKAYQSAVDARSDIRGSKQWMLRGLVEKYREAAWKRIMAQSPALREKMYEAEKASYAAFKSAAQQPAPSQNNTQVALRNLVEGFGMSMERSTQTGR